ncbi:hypothetical protein FBZ92_101318 [Nitrospirillum viridazoti]|uniref:Uncharacterized protein n=1 Tax=Nitrospirillum amazonense TaxID=28077 RepID=A0A560IZG8_9PROT|nr:hypothetical protein FBZ92_101318 [Nitrospirillum amazonense]
MLVRFAFDASLLRYRLSGLLGFRIMKAPATIPPAPDLSGDSPDLVYGEFSPRTGGVFRRLE